MVLLPNFHSNSEINDKATKGNPIRKRKGERDYVPYFYKEKNVQGSKSHYIGIS